MRFLLALSAILLFLIPQQASADPSGCRLIYPARTREVLARSLECAAMNPHVPEFRTGVLQT